MEGMNDEAREWERELGRERGKEGAKAEENEVRKKQRMMMKNFSALNFYSLVTKFFLLFLGFSLFSSSFYFCYIPPYSYLLRARVSSFESQGLYPPAALRVSRLPFKFFNLSLKTSLTLE
jgi:hypothetical protein